MGRLKKTKASSEFCGVTEKLGWHSLGTSFECSCGVRHYLPIDRCYIGPDADRVLAAYAKSEFGGNGLVVADENTRPLGEGVVRGLRDAGMGVREKLYGTEPIDATDIRGDEVANEAADRDFIVAIGAGSLSDLAKYAGDKLNLPVLLYPTAASMNGYSSAIVALKVRGLKRTIPCTPAQGIFADPSVCATAPGRMTAAGIADFLSKCSSSTDWRVGHDLRGGYFCERPREFFEGTEEAVLEAASNVARGDLEAYRAVLEALLLSGCSMVVAGSSSPASGGEHLISHFLDMKAALFGTPHDLHGAQVGVATIYCLGLWERILAMEPARIDVETCVMAQPSPKEVHAFIESDWGRMAPEVVAEWNAKALTANEARKELERFKKLLPEARDRWSADLLSASRVTDAIQSAGGPVMPEELEAPIELYRAAIARARYIRNRFTVLDLAAELNIYN